MSTTPLRNLFRLRMMTRLSVDAVSTMDRAASVPSVGLVEPDEQDDEASHALAVERPPLQLVDVAREEAVPPFKLTIVVPVYNEERTIRGVLDSLIAQPIPGDVEIIVVDDGSTDRTGEILESTWHVPHVGVRHATNYGKGAAVLTGLARASGTHLLVFDADSEYDPADIPSLIGPILKGRADVVYGVRVRGAGTAFPSWINVFGNRLMTATTNALYGSAITDLHTCLKLLPVPMLRRMRLEEVGFGLDTEISAELLRLGFRPYEVPATYVGRSREEGKKIRFADACRCMAVLVKVRLRGRTRYGLRDREMTPAVSIPKAPERPSDAEALATGDLAPDA